MAPDEISGYHFYDRPHPHAPGCARLDVALRAAPTHQHFDPEKVLFTTVSADGSLRHLAVTFSSAFGPEPLRVSAGRITLVDRLDKRMQFFTLGGRLVVTRQADCLRCSFSSPAPIIELALTRRAPQLLAEEIEDILARRRAYWEVRPGEFERRLGAAQPEALYAACLSALARQLAAHHSPFDEDALRLARFVGEERSIICGGSPSVPPLEDIL